MFSSAWPYIGMRSSAFYVDYASFAADSSGLDRLEVYYQIYTSKLLYLRKNGQYVSHFGVSAVIRKGKKQITASETEGFLYKDTYDETSNDDEFLINSFSFLVKPGKYVIEVTLTDLNADTALPLKTDIFLPDYEAKSPSLSSIEFARDISEADDESDFNKKRWKVIPSCSRIYGDDSDRIQFYFEFYSGDGMADTTEFVYEIVDKKKDTIISKTDKRKITEENGVVGQIDIENLKPGAYKLIISAPDGRITTANNFSIQWSALAMVEYDIDTAVEQLRYIATAKEMDKLKNASEEQLIQLWKEFWKSRDPSPGTEENEIQDIYYRRIAYSNEHFSISTKEGWKTDMGMIYILHGEPDDIERHPFDLGSRPYQIWYFYSPRRRFLFIDTKGYGEYILQYPYDGDINKAPDISGGRP